MFENVKSPELWFGSVTIKLNTLTQTDRRFIYSVNDKGLDSVFLVLFNMRKEICRPTTEVNKVRLFPFQIMLDKVGRRLQIHIKDSRKVCYYCFDYLPNEDCSDRLVNTSKIYNFNLRDRGGWVDSDRIKDNIGKSVSDKVVYLRGDDRA